MKLPWESTARRSTRRARRGDPRPLLRWPSPTALRAVNRRRRGRRPVRREFGNVGHVEGGHARCLGRCLARTPPARPPLCRAVPPPVTRLRRRRDAHARARDRNQHGDVQRDERHPAPADALSGARPPFVRLISRHAGRSPSRVDCIDRDFLQLLEAEKTSPIFEQVTTFSSPNVPARRRRAGSALGGCRHADILQYPRRDAGARPRLYCRRGGCRPRRPPLARTIQRRPAHSRQDDRHRQREAYDHRRDAGIVQHAGVDGYVDSTRSGAIPITCARASSSVASRRR